MTLLTPPYFFDEFLLPVKRVKPSDRERTLGLTLMDLDWMLTLYYATDQARQNPRMREAPMVVETLMIDLDKQPSIPLAGVFLMSPSPDGSKALLYTPYGGLEVFDTRADLLTQITQRLNDPPQRLELVRFLSISERDALRTASSLPVTTQLISGAVMENQERQLHAAHLQNLNAILAQLRKTPSLPWMLDTLLSIMGRSYFPDLDQRDTRMDSFVVGAQSTLDKRLVASVPLSEALLQFYVQQDWPADQSRRFYNLRQAGGDARPEKTLQHWESLVTQTAGILSKLLSSLLLTYWNEDVENGRSRLELFAQFMSDTFRLDLLLKRQSGILSVTESTQLLALFLPDQAARTAYATRLRIERVRIQAPYQHYVDLAGTLMISAGCAYLYSQSRGLQVLKDKDDLTDTLRSMLKASGHEDELLNLVSINERSLLIGLDEVEFIGLPIANGVFMAMMKDIVLKQSSNMDYALGLFRRSEGVVDLDALLDQALDVRNMLDNRLLALDAEGRWSLHPVSSGNGRPSTVQAERAKQHLLPLQAAEAALTAQRDHAPTLRRLAAQALNAELEKRQLDLDANDIYINTYATSALEQEHRLAQHSVNMVDHLIERLADQGELLTDTARTGLYGKHQAGASYRIESLTVGAFNAIIAAVTPAFARHDVRTLPHLFFETRQSQLSQSLMMGLRKEAELRVLNKTMAPRAHAILDTVLRPDSLRRLTRHALNGFLPDAFRLTVSVGDDPTPCPLAHCFVLTERGGIDPERSGQAVLWTPRLGHETFTSIQALRRALQRRLDDAQARLPLLENLSISRRTPHQAYQLGPLQRIDDDLIQDRQQSHRDFLLDGVDHLLALHLNALPLQDCLDTLMQQAAPTNVPRALALARAITLQQGLPVWLGMATPAEQRVHAELLEQQRLSALDGEDYLHGIPALREQVAKRLTALLDKRYPGQALNCEHILIPGRRALDGDVQTLTDFALQHHPDLQSRLLEPRSRNATPLPDTLNASAVIQIIQQLELETTYGDWLRKHLGADSDDARQRRTRFCRQLPWQLLRHAHEEKLEERLSATAWSLIQQVLDMPDGLARKGVRGACATIRPLELISTEGATPAAARGIYVIGSSDPSDGPLVLYAPYSPHHTLREYQREEDLVGQISAPGALQEWVLRRLQDPDAATYRNLLQAPSHPQGSEIRLGNTPIEGNLLTRIFDDNIHLLGKMLTCQFVNDAADDWHSLTGLVKDGFQTALNFLQGKLRYPLVVWRSYKLLKISAEHFQQQRFSPAIKTFVSAITQLASLREDLTPLPDPPQPPPSERAAEWEADPAAPATTLATLDVTHIARTCLQPLEVHDVDLNQLTLKPVTQVYEDTKSHRLYVPVAGKVYPVRQAGVHWRLATLELIGPYVRRNATGQWVMDLDRHNPCYGKTLSRYNARYLTRLGERQAMNIEAVGMREIAGLSSWKAQVINEALNVATYYAVTCKRNVLNFAKIRDPNSRIGRFFTELFGVLTLTAEQLQKIEDCLDEVLGELVNHTLTRPDSMRFVCGTARLASESTFAFILPDDAEQKIYLLNPFFAPPMDDYVNRLTTPFDVVAHARAAVLIHEVSHLKCQTEDIAYLDSMRPFHDLINLGVQGAPKMKTDLVNLRDTALSVLTPASLLFKTWNEWIPAWEDVGTSKSTKSIKRKILEATGAKNLADARQIFMTDADKRIATILANADSITYLITQVGRSLDMGA